jgi:Icc-related predicted phosphoesterase
LKYLIFSDLHSFDESKLQLVKTDFDVLVFLGDIRSITLIKILQAFSMKPAVGVLGNHDTKYLFSTVNTLVKNYRKLGIGLSEIENLNGVVMNFGKDSVTGFEGAPGDDDSDLILTQDTASSRLIPAADILFSHETGYHYFDRRDTMHEGFHTISNYIINSKPKYHIFGHHHQNVEFQVEETKCFCVYGCSVFDSESGVIQNFFEE